VKKKVEIFKAASEYAAARKLPLICIINHESLWREPFGAMALDAEWDLAIVDESHRAKAPGGKLSRFLGRLADRVPRRLALTGTPMPHSPLDAYAQYRFLDRSIFGSSFNRFKNRHAVMGGYGGYEIKGWQQMDEFSQNFHEIAFEVTTEEAFDLPEEMDIRRTAKLATKAKKVYDSMEEHFWAEVDNGEVTASNALVKLLRLQQCTSGWIKNDADEMVSISDAKENLLSDVLEDFKVDVPLVIFVRFTKDIEAVRKVCEEQGRRVGEVSGQHKDLTDAGTFPEDLDVMVCQIQSGSLGVNLSRASTCIFYSWGWALGDVEQARARIRHSDNVDKLTFIHLVIEKTIDERMLGALKNRKDFIEDVLERGRGTNGSKEEEDQEEGSQEESRSEAEVSGVHR
jgi:SNF2 family DNA or RNA helicase